MLQLSITDITTIKDKKIGSKKKKSPNLENGMCVFVCMIG
jgi:hypothetical protein